MAAFLARWLGIRGHQAEAQPQEDPLGDALAALQADVRRLGAIAVRGEAQSRQLAERVDALGSGLAAGLDRLVRQQVLAAELQERLMGERARLIGGFLEFADALARARRLLALGGDEGTRDALARLGAHFGRVLRDAGVETIPGEGAPFDPRVHRAVGRVVRPELAGRVAAVDRDGYVLDGRLLRLADVVVGVAAALGEDNEAPEPEAPEPEAPEPEATEPEATEPEATEPEATEPEATGPEATEPEAPGPEAPEPEAPGPEGTELEAPEPEAPEPEAPGPEATEPEAPGPEAPEPEAPGPEGTEPEATEPEATEPEATDPEATEPEATEPEATEPEATDPEASGPEASGPEATGPEATESDLDPGATRWDRSRQAEDAEDKGGFGTDAS